MIVIGSVLIMICVIAVFFGPDNGNAVPFLGAGAIGFVLLIAGVIEAAI